MMSRKLIGRIFVVSNVLGRTNRAWPLEWWRLIGLNDLESVSASLHLNPRPVLAHGSPSIWANSLRGSGCDWVVTSDGGIKFADSERAASNSVVAEIVQSISCSPDQKISIWFMSVGQPLEEFQINGALAGLESAREEGLIQHLGLHVTGSALSVASLWRFHDGFDVVLCAPGNEFDSVATTALSRRVGIVQDGGDPLGFGPVLIAKGK